MRMRFLNIICLTVFFSAGIFFADEALAQKIQYGKSKSGKKYYRYCYSNGCTAWKPVSSSSEAKSNSTGNFEKPTTEEITLWKFINQHRARYRLASIPFSKSLTYVARTHVRDLVKYPPKSPCNAHSWSSHGSWSEICYTPDHANMRGMHNKPRELTNYKGNGYENGAWVGGEQIDPQRALQLWTDDPPRMYVGWRGNRP